MRYLIKMVTPKGGTVLDPFAGSGSTLVAAIHEGMHFVGIEREDEYIKIARKRVRKISKTEVPKQVEKSLFDAMLSGAYEDE
jgi:site-specific DNA-methyltransferase (adenine-specific)